MKVSQYVRRACGRMFCTKIDSAGPIYSCKVNNVSRSSLDDLLHSDRIFAQLIPFEQETISISMMGP